jgi:hypothetical protein
LGACGLLELHGWSAFEYLAVDGAPLHIKAVVHLCVLDRWQRIAHDHHMDRLKLVHVDREHPIYLGDQATLVVVQVLSIFRQDTNHVINFFFTHRLENKLLVAAKEEETARSASSKTCIRDLGYVDRGFQRIDNVLF